MDWGTVGGGKREWGGNGEGEVSLQATWDPPPGWTRIAPHRKERFQVSERDSGTRGVIKGTRQGVAPYALTLSTCTYVSCYCVNVANKRIVFRL